MKNTKIEIEVITDEQIEKLERVKKLLSEIKDLVESIFGEQKND